MGKFKTEDETRKDTISPLKVSFNFECVKNEEGNSFAIKG